MHESESNHEFPIFGKLSLVDGWKFVLASTLISPLFALMTQCTVLALDIFQAFFLSLCDFDSF